MKVPLDDVAETLMAELHAIESERRETEQKLQKLQQAETANKSWLVARGYSVNSNGGNQPEKTPLDLAHKSSVAEPKETASAQPAA